MMGQTKTTVPKQITGIMGGASFSSLYFDGERRDAGFSLASVGIDAKFKLKDKLSLRSAFLISKQSSALKPTVLISQEVTQLLLGPSLKLDDFQFSAGFSLEYRTAPSLSSRTESVVVLTSSEVQPSSQVNLFVGTEFYLGPRFDLYLNGVIPTQSTNAFSFQLGLKYRFHGNKEKAESYRSHTKAMAKKDIVRLKEGALLVRLKTSQNKINALQKVGKEKEAAKAKYWQKTQNEKIVKAFKDKFKFSPVYFFYSYSSDQVREGDFQGIFLNDRLEVDSTIIMDKEIVFTAEYASIEADTLTQFLCSELVQIGNFRSKWVARYYGQPNMSFKAIVLKNQDFQQMAEPFPYYARTNAPGIRKHPEQLLFGLPLIYLLLNPSYESAVEALNYKLQRFYEYNK